MQQCKGGSGASHLDPGVIVSCKAPPVDEGQSHRQACWLVALQWDGRAQPLLCCWVKLRFPTTRDTQGLLRKHAVLPPAVTPAKRRPFC